VTEFLNKTVKRRHDDMEKRKALIIWGGWDGHEPKQISEVFAKMLEGEGFEVEVSTSLDTLLDTGKLAALSLLVPIVTMSKITDEQCAAVLQTVEAGCGVAVLTNGGKMFRKTVLYTNQNYHDYHTYRIPSLFVTREGTILAICEGRKHSHRDSGEIHLLLRRSTDDGKTFSPQEIIWMDGENTCGNPCMVQDAETGRINLLCCLNNDKVFLLISNDEGKTWTEPKEITKDVKKDGWTWYATGPGIGIQLHTTGRLIVPCDHILINELTGEKDCHSHVIYSDDGGLSWRLGGSADKGTDECQAVELSDGSVMLNMRSQDGTRGKNFTRQTAVSSDGGLTWHGQKFDETLIEPMCQASIFRADADAESFYLFTNPANKDDRYNATVRLSYDDCKTWAYDRCFFPERSAYTSLGMNRKGEILCLLECGTITSIDQMVLFTFSVDWIKREDQ
jgi:sialidase-1